MENITILIINDNAFGFTIEESRNFGEKNNIKLKILLIFKGWVGRYMSSI